MGAALHHVKALNTRFDIKIFSKKIKKSVDISVNLCYYNNVRRARQKPSSETHESRVRPSLHQTPTPHGVLLCGI